MAQQSFQFGKGSGGGSAGFQFSPPKSSDDLNITARQAIELQALIKSQGDHKSLLGSLAHGGVSGLSWVLDKLSRPAYAVASGTLAGTKGQGFHLGPALHGAREGFMGRDKATFSDVIKQEFPKWADHHKIWTAVGGLTADILTDPSLPLIVAAQFVPGLNVGVDVAEGGKLAALIGRGATAAERYKNSREAYKGLKELGDGFSAHKHLAALEALDSRAAMAGRVTSRYDQEMLAMAQESAKQEMKGLGTSVIQARYAIPFSRGKYIPLTPTTIAGVRVAPKTPSLARTAEGAGVIGKLPLAAHATNTLGTLFKHGFREEEFAKPALIAQHSQERLEGDYITHAATQFRPLRHLTEEDRMKALSFGEETPDIVRGAGRTLNKDLLNKAVEHGSLTADQGKFVEAWHTHMEYLRARDSEFGVKYEKELGNKVYVPHIYTREGGIATQSAIKRATGFSKEREADLSLRELKNLGTERAKSLNLEDDIMNILTHRTRRAAREHASTTLLDHMRVAGGSIARVPDDVARTKIVSRIAELTDKQNKIPLLNNLRGRQISIGRQVQVRAKKRLSAAVKKHDTALQRYNDKVMEHVHAHLKAEELPAEVEKINKQHDELIAALKGRKDVKAKHRAAIESSRAEALAKAHREFGSRTPSWSRMSKMGAKTLEESTRHFQKADRAKAKELHSILGEVKRLRSKIEKLGPRKGGAATAERAIADELNALRKRLNLEPQDFAPTKRGESWRQKLTDQLEGFNDAVKLNWQKLADDYPNERAVNHAEAVGRIASAQERVVDRLAKDIDKIKADAQLHKAKLTQEFHDEFDKRVKQHESLQKRIDRLDRLHDTKYKRNPDLPPDYIKYEKKIQGEHYYFKPEVHASMSRVEKILTDDRMMAGLGAASRRLLATWKLGVTSINPGYRVRNTMSDLWNMYIAGVPTPQILRYGTKAARLQQITHKAGLKLIQEGPQNLTKKEVNSLRVMAEMYNHGILSGLFQGDVQAVSNLMRSGYKARDYINKNPVSLGKVAVKFAQDFNREAENWGRITHYLYRREYERKSASISADWVKKAHFDYEELTPAERDKFKMIFPFYTWTRKNIPYQLTQMVSRPGKYATFPKVIRTSNELATGEPFGDNPQEGLMPSWMRDQYAFRVPGMSASYMIPQIGVADLSKLEHPKQVLNLMNPAFKTAYEIGTGRSTLTGQPIAGGTHPLNPVSHLGAEVLGSLPGADVGTTSRMVRGEKMYGEGINPWYSYAAGQLPWTNFLVNQQSNIKQAQRGGGVLTDLNFLGGMSVVNRDYETEMTAAQMNFQDQMKRLIRGLRDQGIYPESKTSGKTPAGFNSMMAQIMAGG